MTRGLLGALYLGVIIAIIGSQTNEYLARIAVILEAQHTDCLGAR